MRLRASSLLLALGAACTGSPLPNGSGSPVPTGAAPDHLASASVAATPVPPRSPGADAAADGAARPAPPGSPSGSAATSGPAPVASPPHTGPFARFHDALRALERGERRAHVRIAWLGDSHAQADFWTGAIRAALQQRFGNAGPGFVHLGMEQYRHDRVRFEVKGQWRMRPKKPSTIARSGDGAFGLGGILNAGYAGKRWASIELSDERLAGRPLGWDVCYKHGLAEDEARISLGEDRRTIKPAGSGDVGKLRHLGLAATGPTTLRVDVLGGRPDFCGVVVETDPASHPGVVLDNLGINGARYATALAWDEQAWIAEAVRRAHDLFVLEYGGNEAGDGVTDPAAYEGHAVALVARVRRASPGASCLVVAPADRVDAEDKIPPIVDALGRAAAASGCLFWNTYQVMGGKGSLRRWRDEDKAAPDGVHLKPKGYEELGALLLADLMAGYAR